MIPPNQTAPIAVQVSEYPQRKEITLVTVQGYIDTTTAPEFEKYFLSALNSKKFKLIVDLKDVNYISSAGWGIFVSELKRIRQGNGDLVLSGMNPEVAEIFKLLEFNTFLKSFSNVEDAVNRCFGQQPADPKKDKPAGRNSKEIK